MNKIKLTEYQKQVLAYVKLHGLWVLYHSCGHWEIFTNEGSLSYIQLETECKEYERILAEVSASAIGNERGYATCKACAAVIFLDLV